MSVKTNGLALSAIRRDNSPSYGARDVVKGWSLTTYRGEYSEIKYFNLGIPNGIPVAL